MIIWKWVLELSRVQKIQMPKACRILSLQTQYGKPVLYAAFEYHNQDGLNHKEETRTFVTVGTGDNVNVKLPSLHFLGTYQIDNGAEVYHVFEQR